MSTATVSQAKARLSSLLKKVERGETVVILNRGRAVARIVPVSAAEVSSEQEILQRMERDGVIRRARKSFDPKLLDLPGRPVPDGQGLLAALLQEREEDR